MRLKTLLNQTLLVVALLVCIFFAVLILYSIFQDEIKNNLPVFDSGTITITKEEEDTSSPVRLKIPQIGIDANIERVGLTKDGAMGVPKGVANVGWFDLSPSPGEIGSSVIDGHSGYKNDKPAVFDNLHKLQKGDKIYIEDEKGKTIVFVVRRLWSYDNKKNASEVFSSKDGKAYLNLITCAGDWNAIEKTHSKRLVVFADKE